MSALIDNTQGHYIGKDDAWHGFGSVVGRYFSWEDIVRDGKMAWEPEKKQLISPYDGKPIEAWGIFRSDTHAFLSVVSETYGVISHIQGFEVVDAIVHSQDGAHYSTAGFLGKGETVWGLADLKLDIHVRDDVTKRYLLMVANYDRKMAHLFKAVDERVVCHNTMQIALSEQSEHLLKITHRKNAAKQLDKAKDALLSIKQDTVSMEERFNYLAGRKMTKQCWIDLADKLFPVDEDQEQTDRVKANRNDKMVTVLTRYEKNDNNAFGWQRGTAYNMLNAVTGAIDHELEEDPQKRYKSATFGRGAKIKELAYAHLSEYDLPAMEGYASSKVYIAAPQQTIRQLINRPLAE